MQHKIVVTGTRVHNLKNITVEIPRNKVTVITGLSGSGKSSLAFDTIYAEGQRRYIETFSAYARQFLGNLERPDADSITGLSPVISIEQKTTNRNPRSTVGTTTEIYDFLRLLFARAGTAFSYQTGEKMVRYTDEQILALILKNFSKKKTILLAPIVKSRKGHYKELFISIRKKGFLNVRINGEIKEITQGMKLNRYKTHNIEIVIDKLKVNPKDETRLKNSLNTAMKHGKGVMVAMDADTQELRYFSRKLMCPTSGISYDEPAPNSFSFNSPQGACSNCKGLGTVKEIDRNKFFPNPQLTIKKGGIAPLGEYKNGLIFWQIEAIGKKYGFTLNTPVNKINDQALNIILFGSEETFKIENSPLGVASNLQLTFDGIFTILERQSNGRKNPKSNAKNFLKDKTCPVCQGKRLKKEASYFRFAEKNITELANLDINSLHKFISTANDKVDGNQQIIAEEILKELKVRIQFLLDVGLSYLTLNRSSRSLSGGESQRIRLASQIGSKLVNVLYILDEPSIGLHQRDNQRLINSLMQLRDTGNSVIVVEHDKDMMLAADHLIDMGPGAGKHGGEVIAEGTPKAVLASDSMTAKYLDGRLKIEIPKKRRKGSGEKLVIKGASGNNLKNVNVEFPLGVLIGVTGVSGSGKSSLITGTLYPILNRHFYNSVQTPHPFKKVEGLDFIDKVIEVNQSPIGRTPRSNPATYTKMFDDIRKLFANLPESKIRGYKLGRFSFNVKGGRCETCKRAGLRTIEMNFLPDVYVECEDCRGKRYNRETLEVRYKGKSINDILQMIIEESLSFFENIPKIRMKVQALNDVGLGYVTLGQQSTTLSGGESQRVKLAAELAKKDTGKTFYILDEPTTGLHFEDIRMLLSVLERLVNRGNTVLVIEHNLDVIKTADYIIDIGPEGGVGGGKILCTGTPEKVSKHKTSHTAKFLREELF